MSEAKVNYTNKDSVEIRGTVSFGKGISLGTNVIFDGDVVLSDNVVIGDFVKITNSIIKANSEIKEYSLIENAEIGSNSFVGPYARIRPQSKIGDNCQIGNFVEIKNSSISNMVRINHMAFIGDALIEDDVTIGAGVITCNHDGIKTNQTIIKRGAYIGSNSNLVAPLKIFEEAVIGSGSTIDEDVPGGKLTLARVRQKVIESWKGFKN